MCCASPSARALFLLRVVFCICLITLPNFGNAQPGSEPTAEEQKEKLAADKFLDLLVKKPATGTALERVFGYHVERGTIASLTEKLSQTAQQASNPDEAGRHYLLLGLVQLQRGEDAQAVRALEKAQSLLKENPLAAFHHGQALLLIGNTDAAATAFEATIARKPARNDYLNVARELGRLYQRAGKSEDALRIWNDLEKNFPGDDSVRGRIAATLVEEGDLAGALVRYEAMAKAAKAENDRIVFSLDAARLRSQLGQKEQALKDFDALLAKLRPGSYLYDEARRRIENIFLTSGDYAGLTQYYESWLKDHPDDLNVILRMARTLSLQGRSSEAIERFEQAIKRAPNDEGARLACIDAYLAANRYTDAATQFEALIKVNSKNPDYLVRYGQVLLSDTKNSDAERAKAAAEVWKRLSEAKPNVAAVHSQVADLLRGAKLTDEAIASYRTAIALAPDEPQHKEYLGEYLHQLKRTDEAMAVWRSLAEGNARNLENLVRLAEVFRQFEQPAEALKVMADACELKPKVIHRLRYVEWLSEAKEFEEASRQLELSRKEADNSEDRARIFAAAIKTYQATGKLVEQIQQATAAVQAKPTDGEQWRQLAMLHEANANAAEALKAIEKAVAAEPGAIETLEVAARMTEASGRVAEAIDLRKRLVDIDRRFRSAHLQRLATLYSTAGQAELAIATGKELLASAGGAIDSFRFYADLCGQLGRADERLDTVRRCLRLNPRSIEANELLANQLADDFKTEQAIELVWKQLDLAEDIEKRRSVVMKLTDLYLRGNRLDQLISRLEFRGREANDRRTAIDLTSTAYQQAGDLGLARDALEGLLRESGRDTLLMERLVVLAQQAGETDRAIELQRELVRLAPGKQTEARLASLLIDVGSLEEAQTLWLSSVDLRGDISPLLRAIDQLFTSGEYKAAYDLSGKILEANPTNWELLTRRMILAALAEEWDSAVTDARTILAMNVPENDESSASKQRKAKQKSANRPLAPASFAAVSSYPLELQRIQSTSQLVMLLDPRYAGRTNALPAPDDFGIAKRYASFLILKRADEKGESDKVMAELKASAMSAEATAREVWEWYAAEASLARTRQTNFEDFRNPETWTASWRILEVDLASGLTLLGMQFRNRQQYAYGDQVQMNPLPPERLQWLKEQSSKATAQPNVVSWSFAYATELRIAGKKEEAEQFLKDKQNWPDAKGPEAYQVLSMIQQQGDDEALWQAIQQAIENEKTTPQWSMQRATITSNLVGLFTDRNRVTKKLSQGADDATYRQRVMQLIDRMTEEYVRRSAKGNTIRLTSIGGPRQTYQMIGNNYQEITIEFPPSGIGPDDEYLRVFYMANQQLKNYIGPWVVHLTKQNESNDPRLTIERLVSAACLQQWNEKTVEARELLEQALKLATEHVPQQESSLRLLLADLLLRQDRKQDALAIIEGLSVYDQNTMAVREFAAARLASVLGDRARAEQAARRLIGVRLDPDAQIELARLMRSLKMNDLAADVVRRLRGRTGSSNAQLQTLLNYFLSQNEKEAAAEVAMDLLQRTAPSPKRPGGSMTVDQSMRNQALQALSNSGQLKGLIDSTKKRQERAPNSQRIRAELSDMYRVAGMVQELDALLNKNSGQKVESTAGLEASAKQLVQAGKWSEACDAYLKVIRRNPQLISRDFYEIERPFSQSKRLADLADVIIEVGVAKFESYRVAEVCERLIRNEQNHDKGRQLFVAILEQRNVGRNMSGSLNNVSDEFRTLINDEVMLIKVANAIINLSTSATANSWSEAFSGYSTSGDGRKNNCLTYLVRFVADKPEMAQALEKRLQEEIAKKEDWQEGKIWLGLLMAATKRYDEAKQLLEPLTNNRPLSGNESLWLIGSLIDSHKPLYPLAEKLYEQALKELDSNSSRYSNSDFQYTLPARVSQFMLDQGNKSRAREIAMAELQRRSQQPARQSFNDPSYEAYEAINATMSMMKFLAQVDAQVEALKLARKLDRGNFAKAAQYTSRSEAEFDKQIKQIEADLQRMGGLVMLESMVDAETKGANAVELGISMDNRPFTGNGLKSLWQEMTADAAEKPDQADAIAKLVDRLKKLVEARPQDTSVRIALAISNSYMGSRESLDSFVNESSATATTNKTPDKPADAESKPGVDELKPQWLALAYLRWVELEQGQESSVDVLKIRNWLSERAQAWPPEIRVHVVAALGKRQLAKKELLSAAALWSLCLEQEGATQWMLVDLAIAAAREKMTELSLKSATAAAKAVDKLPGDESAKAASSLGELLGAQQRQNRSVNRSVELDNDAKSPLATRLIELDKIWSDNQIEPKQLVEPLSALVSLSEKSIQPLPIKYEQSSANEWKLDSVFERLARRAHACGQTETLVAKIVGEKDGAASSPEMLVKDDATKVILIALAWLRNECGDKAVDYLKVLDATQLNSIHRTIVLQTLLAGLEDQTCRRTAAELGMGWAALNKPTQRYAEAAPFNKLSLEIVRKAIQHNMNKELRSSAIALYLELCRHENDRYQGTMQFTQYISQLEEIAKLYLSNGNNAEALQYFGQRQALTNQGFDRDDDWLGSWLLENVQSKIDRLEAYQLLADWTFQGDASLNAITAFSRRSPLPEWIPEDIGGKYPNFAPMADKNLPLVSSFYSLALLADEIKQAEKLLASYQTAYEQKRTGAAAGLAITLVALKRPVPAELLKELSARLTTIRPEANANAARAAAPLAELNLALIFNANRENVDWTRETFAEVERHGSSVSRAYLTPWLSRYSYQHGWSPFSSFQPSEGLQHWSVNTTGTAKDFYEGKTAPLWLVDGQGQVAHLCGFATDWMWWRYPMEGNFEFEFETQESSASQMELYVGSLRFATTSTYVDVTSDDSRDWIRFNATEAKKDQWNKHMLTLDDKEMKYSVNGTVIYKEARLPGVVSLALRSLGTRQSISRNIKFSGQPKIAKSMALVDGDHLRGWSSYYYSESLPSSKLDTSTREGGSQSVRAGLSSNDKANLSWTVENEELVSGDGRTSGPGKQSLVQYIRPMSAGEKIEFEFYYEPGKFEVHPSMGRTAFLLKPAGIERHWMTEPDTSWKTPADNHFPVEGSKPLALVAGQWNSVTLESLADRMTVSVNGQLVLELPWQYDTTNSTFGLFHVKGQTQVRVRKITLSGAWPTEMPTEVLKR